MDITTCTTCTTPHAGTKCDNPGCPESGNVSRESWETGRAKIVADREEAERFARLRAASFGAQDVEDVEEPERRTTEENDMSQTRFAPETHPSIGTAVLTAMNARFDRLAADAIECSAGCCSPEEVSRMLDGIAALVEKEAVAPTQPVASLSDLAATRTLRSIGWA